MSNILSILNNGVTGLYASQAQIDAAGNNITNVNTEGYSRQRVVLKTAPSQITGEGVFGRGVKVDDVKQVYDSLLANTLRSEDSDLSYYTSMQNSLDEVGLYFNELEDGSGLGEAMAEYFNAWSDLSNTATDESDESLIKKQTVVQKADNLSEKISGSYQSLQDIKAKANSQISGYITKVNQITDNISNLNGKIALIETTGVTANDLRDERERLLNQLAKIANISVADRPSGQIAVYIGGNVLVDEGQNYKLTAQQSSGTDDTMQIIWNADTRANNSADVSNVITSGELGALLSMRDDAIPSYLKSLDQLASALITKTNAIHALGQGTVGLTQITSSNGVKNASYRLGEDAGALPTAVQSGVMRIAVYDADHNLVNNLDIDIDPDSDSLNSVISKISMADGNPEGGMIQASLSQNNTIKITAGSGYTFAFAEDTSNFLVAAGINGFFSGSSASDMSVSSLVKSDIGFLATSLTGAEGDNRNAVNIANLKGESVFDSSSVTFDEFYSLFTAGIATQKGKIDTYQKTKAETVNQYTLKLESVRGVSLDEELTDMMKFQKAYEASARYITVVDEMIDKVVNGMGTAGR